MQPKPVTSRHQPERAPRPLEPDVVLPLRLLRDDEDARWRLEGGAGQAS